MRRFDVGIRPPVVRVNQEATGTGCLSAREDSEERKDSFELELRDAAKLLGPNLTPVALPRSGELVDDKYLVEELLAAGGMGAVFRATHRVSGKEVALKWLLPSVDRSADRFLREARAAARIEHPNVVDVYDLGTHRGGHYLVMELLRGRSLRERLRSGRMSPPALVAIMVPLLRGVAAAHARGVIHRDLKPDNLFLCEGQDGTGREPKVLDFGIAKLRATCGDTEHLTKSGSGIGTPAYMSPEQLIDASNVDERTDIYATGVIMYEALTGRVPFANERSALLSGGALAVTPLPLRHIQSDVPEALERVVLRALAGSPAERHANVDALIEDLQAALGPAKAKVVSANRIAAQRVAAVALTLLLLVLTTMFAGPRWKSADASVAQRHGGVIEPAKTRSAPASDSASYEPLAAGECSASAVEHGRTPCSSSCGPTVELADGEGLALGANGPADRRTSRDAPEQVAPRASVRASSTPRAGRILRSEL